MEVAVLLRIASIQVAEMAERPFLIIDIWRLFGQCYHIITILLLGKGRLTLSQCMRDSRGYRMQTVIAKPAIDSRETVTLLTINVARYTN